MRAEEFKKLSSEEKKELVFWLKAFGKGLEIPQEKLDALIYYGAINRAS